jgi:hypothetical protein
MPVERARPSHRRVLVSWFHARREEHGSRDEDEQEADRVRFDAPDARDAPRPHDEHGQRETDPHLAQHETVREFMYDDAVRGVTKTTREFDS